MKGHVQAKNSSTDMILKQDIADLKTFLKYCIYSMCFKPMDIDLKKSPLCLN